jgi:hypothetical protein
VILFRNDLSRNEEIRNPRKKRTLSSEQPVVKKPAKSPKREDHSKVQRDWISALMTRNGEDFVQKAHDLWNGIDQEKMIHVVTDGGANPSTGSAGWGARFRQSKRFTMMWKHFDHATNNTMELRAAAKELKYQLCRFSD